MKIEKQLLSADTWNKSGRGVELKKNVRRGVQGNSSVNFHNFIPNVICKGSWRNAQPEKERVDKFLKDFKGRVYK